MNYGQFPLREVTGDRWHDRDVPAMLTEDGDYIVYHGTSWKLSAKIISERTLLHDDMRCVGITTHPSEASIYGIMKAMKEGKNPKNPSTVLRVVIEKEWLDSQTIQREVGGSGRNQFLINIDKVPPEAIKDICVAGVRGSYLRAYSYKGK